MSGERRVQAIVRAALIVAGLLLCAAAVEYFLRVYATQTPDSASRLSFTVSAGLLSRMQWLTLVLALACLVLDLYFRPMQSGKLRTISLAVVWVMSIAAIVAGLVAVAFAVPALDLTHIVEGLLVLFAGATGIWAISRSRSLGAA